MPGRKPTPTALKLLSGTPGRRPLNTSEPQFEAGLPPKPEWFDTYASEEWDRITGNLNGQHIFTKNDLGILVSVCLAYEQLRETLAIIKELGRSYSVEDMGGNKHYKARPECVRFETAQKEYRTLLSEIGFSPSSRSKVKAIPDTKESGIDKFLTRNK
ncbi:MAG: phage terminase small subunit P27 family [Nitrospirales bacterium]